MVIVKLLTQVLQETKNGLGKCLCPCIDYDVESWRILSYGNVLLFFIRNNEAIFVEVIDAG
jgi:hypothetical protein